MTERHIDRQDKNNMLPDLWSWEHKNIIELQNKTRNDLDTWPQLLDPKKAHRH